MPFITRHSGLTLAYDVTTTRSKEDGTVIEGNKLNPIMLTRGFSFAKPDGRETDTFKENVYDGRIHSQYQALDGSAWFYIRHDELSPKDFKRFLDYYLTIRQENRDIPHTIFVGDLAVDAYNEKFPRKNLTKEQFDLLKTYKVNGKSVFDYGKEDSHPIENGLKAVSQKYIDTLNGIFKTQIDKEDSKAQADKEGKQS